MQNYLESDCNNGLEGIICEWCPEGGSHESRTTHNTWRSRQLTFYVLLLPWHYMVTITTLFLVKNDIQGEGGGGG